MRRSLVMVNISKITYFLVLLFFLCIGMGKEIYAAEQYLVEFYNEECLAKSLDFRMQS